MGRRSTVRTRFAVRGAPTRIVNRRLDVSKTLSVGPIQIRCSIHPDGLIVTLQTRKSSVRFVRRNGNMAFTSMTPKSTVCCSMRPPVGPTSEPCTKG